MAGPGVKITGFDAAVKRATTLTRQEQAAQAIAAHSKVMQAPPQPISFVRHVDGVLGAPETAVKTGGVIVYDYGRLDLAALYALDILRQLSPVDEGDYVRSHVVMLNGNVIGSTDSRNGMQLVELKNYKRGDRLTISNLMPYTRKIELGKEGFRRHGHVYERAERVINRQMGNMCRCFFIYEKAPRGGGDGGMRSWAYNTGAGGHSRDFNRGAKRQEYLTRQPTLLLKEPS